MLNFCIKMPIELIFLSNYIHFFNWPQFGDIESYWRGHRKTNFWLSIVETTCAKFMSGHINYQTVK